jgi:hypothetical protein
VENTNVTIDETSRPNQWNKSMEPLFEEEEEDQVEEEDEENPMET